MLTTRHLMLLQILKAVEDDERIVGLVDYGSASEGRADDWSDLDIALFIRDSDLQTFETTWTTWAAQFGPLLLAYVGGVGHPWSVYDALPIPLRVDFAFHPASRVDILRAWPNAPISVEQMVLYDHTGGSLTDNAQHLVGQYLGPKEVQQTFTAVCGDFWYYFLRTWSRLQRGEEWSARYDFNQILVGNLLALLRLEAGAVDRWRSTSAATRIEHILTPQRLSQLNLCIPERGHEALLRAFDCIAKVGYEVSAAIADSHGWDWPRTLADRVITIVERDD